MREENLIFCYERGEFLLAISNTKKALPLPIERHIASCNQGVFLLCAPVKMVQVQIYRLSLKNEQWR